MAYRRRRSYGARRRRTYRSRRSYRRRSGYRKSYASGRAASRGLDSVTVSVPIESAIVMTIPVGQSQSPVVSFPQVALLSQSPMFQLYAKMYDKVRIKGRSFTASLSAIAGVDSLVRPSFNTSIDRTWNNREAGVTAAEVKASSSWFCRPLFSGSQWYFKRAVYAKELLEKATYYTLIAENQVYVPTLPDDSDVFWPQFNCFLEIPGQLAAAVSTSMRVRIRVSCVFKNGKYKG